MAHRLIISAFLAGLAAVAGCSKPESTPGAASSPGGAPAVVTPSASPASDPSLPDAASAVGSPASAASAP
jgi:hypothetical protein